MFIVNPISGGQEKKRILSLLEQFASQNCYEVDIRQTGAKGDAITLARESDADLVVAVGGDGTVNEVAQGLIGQDKILGIIPCGSGNGLALHLGISLNPKRALRTLLEGRIELIDYAQIDEHPFFSISGIGLDADVAWEFATTGQRGLWTYISLAWEKWRQFRAETYSIDIDGNTITTPAVIIAVGNSNQWGNQARITSLASVCDGMLDVCIVKPFKTIEIPILATKLLTGRAHTSHRIRMIRGKRIMIRRQHDGPAHYDGEPCFEGDEIQISALPAALKVIVPSNSRAI